MIKWLGGLFDSNEKVIKRLQPTVDRINSLEPEFSGLSDAALRARTDEFRERLKEATADLRQELSEAQDRLKEAGACLLAPVPGFDRESVIARCGLLRGRIDELDKELQEVETDFLDTLLPEAFAAVREAARRTIGQRHYDVQLIGGAVLHQGKIAEMRTGEGKTLVATLPLYLNSLTGRGCHLVTVNDYLARRDPYWMGPVFHALGISVASIYPQQNPDEYAPARRYDPDYDAGEERWRHFRPITRQEAYQTDITYGTSSEFGFDYLRDNMVVDLSRCVQRPQNYAIVDEVDNLLIDEARTPLIISGPAQDSGEQYNIFARLVPRLKEETDYVVDAKTRTVNLTDNGISTMERMLQRDGLLKSPSLYDPANYSLTHFLDNAMKAHALYRRDRDYVVKNGEVIIVDEFTGRLMVGRRYSEGLHQAIEAKEHVKVQRETMTFATITIQNYFRMYRKLAGMTGTAVTEAEEFFKIYKLEVVVIPTNKPMVRDDLPDQIYKSEEGKFKAVVREVKQLYEQQRPVLIGTVSIEKSEMLSDMLKRQGIVCQILNAKEHTKEGEIIAGAGIPGAVTVATNMAGRGVDIILGGNPDGDDDKAWQPRHELVLSNGGLHIIGTERHEARRIDNQLRGRAGRQGDPGSTRFFISLEDDIMRRFGSDRIKGIMEWAGMEEDTPIENTLITRAISDVQKRVEGYHFDLRKHLVEYDDVVNKHRELIYGERHKVLSGTDLRENALNMVNEEIRDIVKARLADRSNYEVDYAGMLTEVAALFPLPPEMNAETISKMKPEPIIEALSRHAAAVYDTREKEVGPENMRLLEKLVMLRIIDSLWIEHLTEMERMRMEAGWESLRQVKPIDAYKRAGFRRFEELMATIRHDVARTIFHVTIEKREAPPTPETPLTQASGRAGAPPRQKVKAGSHKIGRNEPCPCGSGKKYKHCCGK
ncbi:MAG: preprotein translocase subunit SecA [Chloroflexota bacterium]